MRLRRRDSLLAAGLIDSFGLSVGWTALALHAVATEGFEGLGILSAAMLIGVTLSAPVTAWLAARVDGRGLLWGTAAGEAVLRALSFGALLLGLPVPAVAVMVLLSNILAWAGFAGMRAEVDAADGGAGSLSAYTALIAAAESGGAFVAAALPTGADGALSAHLVVAVLCLYALSLLPTMMVAAGARTGRQPREVGDHSIRELRGLLVGGAGVALLSAGPPLLAVGIATGMYGRGAVGPALLAFTVGSLAGPAVAGWLSRGETPPALAWPLLGLLMLGGWSIAGVSIFGLLLAQLLAGIGFAAFEGLMDADVVHAARGRVTGALAWAASARAIGSSIAVAALPVVLGEAQVPQAATAGAGILVVVLLLVLASGRGRPVSTALGRGPRTVMAQAMAATSAPGQRMCLCGATVPPPSASRLAMAAGHAGRH